MALAHGKTNWWNLTSTNGSRHGFETRGLALLTVSIYLILVWNEEKCPVHLQLFSLWVYRIS